MGVNAAFRACLLSGGASRRMGRDKALLPHPEAGSWLEHCLISLAALGAPITVLSRHAAHLALAKDLALQHGWALDAFAEPPPWEGPLLALRRLAEREPQAQLLVVPVDMPALHRDCLETLLAVAVAQPELIHVAHDGERLQPLLAVLPAGDGWRQTLQRAVGRGERRWQRWLMQQQWRPVPLEPRAMRNINTPHELRAFWLEQPDP